MAIVYNLGSNVFMGEISYVTQALAAVVTCSYDGLLDFPLAQLPERTAGTLPEGDRNVRCPMQFQDVTFCCGKFHYNGGRVYALCL